MDSFHQCPGLQGKDVQVGVILYNCVPWTHAKLGQFAVGSDIMMYRMMDIDYTGGMTETGLAIRHTRFTSDFRKGSKRAVIVLTDGTTEDPAGVATEAAEAQDAGINLYGVRVGPFASLAGLEHITGDAQRIFTVTSDPCIAAQKIMDDLTA
ncbi:cuticlin-6-like [Branchiostoma floridae x Branchiostoma belcheri]